MKPKILASTALVWNINIHRYKSYSTSFHTSFMLKTMKVCLNLHLYYQQMLHLANMRSTSAEKSLPWQQLIYGRHGQCLFKVYARQYRQFNRLSRLTVYTTVLLKANVTQHITWDILDLGFFNMSSQSLKCRTPNDSNYVVTSLPSLTPGFLEQQQRGHTLLLDVSLFTFPLQIYALWRIFMIEVCGSLCRSTRNSWIQNALDKCYYVWYMTWKIH